MGKVSNGELREAARLAMLDAWQGVKEMRFIPKKIMRFIDSVYFLFVNHHIEIKAAGVEIERIDSELAKLDDDFKQLSEDFKQLSQALKEHKKRGH